MNIDILKSEYELLTEDIAIISAKEAMDERRFDPYGNLKIDNAKLDFEAHVWADNKIRELDFIRLREDISENDYEEMLSYLESI